MCGWIGTNPAHVTMPFVLERERRFRVVAIRQAQENDFGLQAKDRKRRSDALGFGKAVEAPMKIYHAFIFGRLIRLAGSKANQFVAQRGEDVGLHDPDDDIEFRKKRHRARLLVEGDNWRFASGKLEWGGVSTEYRYKLSSVRFLVISSTRRSRWC